MKKRTSWRQEEQDFKRLAFPLYVNRELLLQHVNSGKLIKPYSMDAELEEVSGGSIITYQPYILKRAQTYRNTDPNLYHVGYHCNAEVFDTKRNYMPIMVMRNKVVKVLKQGSIMLALRRVLFGLKRLFV